MLPIFYWSNIPSKCESASMNTKTLDRTIMKILKLLKRNLPKENQTAMSYKWVLEDAIEKVDKIDFDRIKL